MASAPVVVIVGPTASGKTGAAIQLARQMDGEIISADSRAIYRGMDVGTAKPSIDERQGIPHWGIDLVSPDEPYSAADFQAYAYAKITDIQSRGKLPIIVGGTGLYVDAVIFEYGFEGERGTAHIRDALDEMTLAELYEYCIKNNISLPPDDKNKRRLIGAIVRNGASVQRRSVPDERYIIVGITTDKNVLHQRIAARAADMLRSGVIEEAQKLAARYGWEHESMSGNVYPAVHRYTEGVITKSELVDMLRRADTRLAKRQMTWFRRNPYIEWCDRNDVVEYIMHTLPGTSRTNL